MISVFTFFTGLILGMLAVSLVANRTYNKGFNFVKNDVFVLNPFVLGTVNTAASFLRTKKYQIANKGISTSNQRNSGFRNSKLLQFIIFLNWFWF